MNEKKNHKFYKVIMLVLVTAFVTFLLTTVGVYNYIKENTDSEIATQIVSSELDKKILRVQKIIDEYYLGEEVEKSVLEEGAVMGYVDALNDPYTEYIPAEYMKEYTESLLGNFVGIGIYMVNNEESNRVEVLTPIKNSPAEEAGILPGDLIIKVDGVEYTGDQMSQVSTEVKGEEGTTVKLEILRGTETLNFEIIREKIIVNPVISEKLENDIGYIALYSFDEETANQFKDEYEKLKAQNIKSLIIDLRNNGGGIVDESLKIASYILDKDSTMLITVDKNNNEEIQKNTKDPIINMPIVVLVNENTASASEILAGALKDLNKATIVGTQTYGKGVIQQFLTLVDGSGLKITTEEYYTPNRNKINKIGIEPNEVVELPEDVKNVLMVDREQDTQLKKAIDLLK